MILIAILFDSQIISSINHILKKVQSIDIKSS